MNEQEEFWSGEFGDRYNERNVGLESDNRVFFLKALPSLCDVSGNVMIRDLCEYGCGTGNNLRALFSIWPELKLYGVEINEEACNANTLGHIFHSNFLDFSTELKFDLTMTKGVLIHLHPDNLSREYKILYETSNRFILLAEYYSPTPAEAPYRGHLNKLWKRDFAGEMMEKYPDLKLVDYGFVYHGDEHPQDDVTWFLMEKE